MVDMEYGTDKSYNQEDRLVVYSGFGVETDAGYGVVKMGNGGSDGKSIIFGM